MKIKTTKENNFDHTWNYFSIQWPRILVSTPGCKQLWGNPGLEWILGRRILRIPLSPRKEPWRVTRKGLLEWPLSNSFSNTNAILDWSFVPHWSLQGCSIACKKSTCHGFVYFFNPTCITSERSQSLRNETSTQSLWVLLKAFPPQPREVIIKQVSIPLRSV